VQAGSSSQNGTVQLLLAALALCVAILAYLILGR
jgi:hypothetical protein